jgi:hypothetical protein
VEPIDGIRVAVGRQRVVDARRPAVFLKGGENGFLIAGRLAEAFHDDGAQAQLAAIRVP